MPEPVPSLQMGAVLTAASFWAVACSASMHPTPKACLVVQTKLLKGHQPCQRPMFKMQATFAKTLVFLCVEAVVSRYVCDWIENQFSLCAEAVVRKYVRD